MTNWRNLPSSMKKRVSGNISINGKLKPNKANKMRNEKIRAYGRTWDSSKELSRYRELLLLEKAGLISDIVIQPYFLLLDTLRDKETGVHAKKSYTADFSYFSKTEGKTIVEDVKSKFTAKIPYYRFKIHLFLTKYPDICFREVL